MKKGQKFWHFNGLGTRPCEILTKSLECSGVSREGHMSEESWNESIEVCGTLHFNIFMSEGSS